TGRRQRGLRTLGCQLCILHSCSLSAGSNLPSWFRDLAKVHVNTGFCGAMSFLSANSAYK
ncbi:hypothetical protein N301_08149, partial [Charadrius vociferus]